MFSLQFDHLDQHTFNLLINSRRRFKSLTIDCSCHRSTAMNGWEISDRFMKVIEHFGRHIKHLTIKYFHANNIVKLLSFMPNLVKIYLYRIWDAKFDPSSENNFKLNLNKLKEVRTSFCNESVLSIFNWLPHDILRKIDLQLHDISNSPNIYRSIKLFEDQTKIVDVEATEKFADLICFERIKLEKLKLWGNNDLNRMLNGQTGIKSLNLSSIKPGDMKIIYNELLSLENLEVGYAENISSFEFAELSRLKKLRKLSLEFDEDAQQELDISLGYAQSLGLVELTLRFMPRSALITGSTLQKLGKNMPELKKLHLSLNSESPLTSLHEIVQNMQNLEFLNFTSNSRMANEQLVFQSGVGNETLQDVRISLETYNDYEELLKLFKLCKNLKTLSLRLGNVKNNFFMLLKKGFGSLNYFECNCSINDDPVAFYQKMHEEFKNQFTFIDLTEDFRKVSLVMKNQTNNF